MVSLFMKYSNKWVPKLDPILHQQQPRRRGVIAAGLRFRKCVLNCTALYCSELKLFAFSGLGICCPDLGPKASSVFNGGEPDSLMVIDNKQHIHCCSIKGTPKNS